jgi:hypothetical protein
MIRLVGLGSLAVAAAWLVLSAGPIFGQQSPNGTVTATVIANSGPCISLDQTTFSYAPAQFSTASSVVTTVPNTAKPVVTNCSNQTSTLSASSGPATGATPNWVLQGSSLNCNEGPNKYRHELIRSGGVGNIALTLVSQTWESSVSGTGGTGNTRVLDGVLTMPCTGSSGAGLTMSMQILLTAVVQ